MRKPKVSPKKDAKQAPKYSSKEFFLDDLPSTLFPLTTNKVLVEKGHEELLEFAQNILSGNGTFLPQRRVYANKDTLHLRRTVKLDAVAELYLYDLVYRNRGRFRKPHNDTRQHFGYRFSAGRPLSSTISYASFKAAVWEGTFLQEEFTYFDISSYFNGVYHHDLHSWFSSLKPELASDVEAFGRFFREINAGRSLDCLPQGLYPAKMIGNDFLRFIESSSSIRSERIVRFMDDIYIFDDDMNVITADFAEIQRLLGLKGLSVNSSKTRTGGTPQTDEADEQVSELKKKLLQRRRTLIVSHYDEDEDTDSLTSVVDEDNDDDDSSENELPVPEVAVPLDEEEISFILSILNSDTITEDDAELILVVMRDHVDRIEGHLDKFAKGFPHLAKNFCGLCSEASNKDNVAEIVLAVTREGSHIGEYQLFWFGVMLENYLMDTKVAPDLLHSLYKHQSSTDISRAKILEIADSRYGLPEMREVFLREGRSDWLAWASAVGSREMDKQARNYLLGYFANGSDMNKLIARILQKD